MTDRLSVYNRALRELGEGAKLASLTEARAPRRALDDVWDDGIRFCLEQGFWNFALRSVQLAASASVTPAFGQSSAFAKPDDWIRTLVVSDNEAFQPALKGLLDEGGYWLANTDTLFVRYVSRDPAYGLDLSRWPATFAEYVAIHLAWTIASATTGSESKTERLEKRAMRLRMDARSKDAMNEPPAEMPRGTWSLARRCGSSFSRENG